jgi:hypothetical protein
MLLTFQWMICLGLFLNLTGIVAGILSWMSQKTSIREYFRGADQ